MTPKIIPSEETISDVAALFAALSDPSRLHIVAVLLEGEKNVGDVVEAVGLSQSAVSHHLRQLRQLRLVKTRKVGRHVFYALDDAHVADLYRCGLEHVLHG